MTDTILNYNSVTISFEGEKIVDHVSFFVHRGKALAIVGESGSGKSTIIKSIMGILNSDGKIEEGEILFENENLLNKSEKELRKLRGNNLGMIFQDTLGSFCQVRTIGAQITEAIRAHQKVDKKEIKNRAIALFKKLNFNMPEKIWNSYPFQLSGGMNQRVAIAMTMLLNPPLLLADEPTSALDEKASKMVIEELKKMRDSLGTSIIIVTHDMGIVSDLADDVLVLKDGRVIEFGETKQVIKQPKEDYTKLLIEAVPPRRSNGWKLSLM